MFEETGTELSQPWRKILNTDSCLQPTVCPTADALEAGLTTQRRRLLANSNG